jgi:hypothetical protein
MGKQMKQAPVFFVRKKRKKQRFLLLKEQFVRVNGDHQGRTLWSDISDIHGLKVMNHESCRYDGVAMHN